MPKQPLVILWLKEDLRLSDNPALSWASAKGRILPLYILEENDPYCPGAASRWWLHNALEDFRNSLKHYGLSLTLRRGNPEKVLKNIAQETGARIITWSRRYGPSIYARDLELSHKLIELGYEVKLHAGYTLFEPSHIKSNSGTPYKVFTPFSKACFASPSVGLPLAIPNNMEGCVDVPSDQLNDWGLIPVTAQWTKGLSEVWKITEKHAQDQLNQFIEQKLCHYKLGRDYADKNYTSRLSPYLHFGQISPRQIWSRIQLALERNPSIASNAERFMLEILWREFSYHLIHHFPSMIDTPLNQSFLDFPWQKNPVYLRSWQQGSTGYPIVDAGMRQLWKTGWMHNRVRMVVASFLIKDLLIDWREGMAWFWDTLVDADIANNTASWQWVAGCGADAAPYFRIFNPVLQGKKYDPDGHYVRQYVPELKNLDPQFIHEPWKASSSQLAQAGIVLGKDYPFPIVDHNVARQQALEALKRTKD